MARKQRIHYPGALYHVILCGNAQQDIFFENGDWYRFYLLLQTVVEKFGCHIHAFCLMTNHVHIAIQVGETPLSRIMQNLALRYTTWINPVDNISYLIYFLCMNGKQVIKLLEKEGWKLDRTTGSHHLLEKDGKVVPVPVHGTADLGKGLIAAIQRQTGVTLK